MKNCNTNEQTTRGTRLVACAIALGLTFAVALPEPAHAQTVTPPPVPAGLEVEAGNEAFLVGHATGTQNYVCQPSPSIGRVAWSLFTPQATLFNDEGEQIITHFFSPNPSENRLVRADRLGLVLEAIGIEVRNLHVALNFLFPARQRLSLDRTILVHRH